MDIKKLSWFDIEKMYIVRDILHWFSRYRFKLIVLLAAAVWEAVLVWPGHQMALVFCAVGQGDAAVVSRGFTQVLIDAGPANQAAADCLARRLPFFDRRLEAVIISHPQADHFGGLPQVFNRYQVDKFIYNGYAGDSRGWAELSQLIDQEGSQIITLAAGDKIRFGRIEIDVLWPADKDYKNYKSYKSEADNKILGVVSSRDPNADALVLALSYGDFSALFTGDISATEENAIINNQQLAISNLSIFKVPHHGSKTSSSARFLEAVRPALAVIEVGKNSYGHPADEVLKRLAAVGAKVLRTDRDGDVVVKTNGKSWRIKEKIDLIDLISN
jgi:competence protein ComEC